MSSPPIPENESTRLQALHDLKILDSDNDPDIDIITKFAGYVLNAPVCLVSLVDENRQWFKSRVGIEAKETPRSVSFCAHAICEYDTSNSDSRLFEICDTHKDKRFADNALVTEKPKIRYYLGYVLKSKTNTNLGTLCIIDTKPRKFSEDEINLVKTLGKMAQNAINGYSYFPK